MSCEIRFLIRIFFVYSVESKNNTTLDGCGKPNSEMLEIMARRQQKLAQKNGQGRRMWVLLIIVYACFTT